MIIIILGWSIFGFILSAWTNGVARKRFRIQDATSLDGKFKALLWAMAWRLGIPFLLICTMIVWGERNAELAGEFIAFCLPLGLYVVGKCGNIIRKRRKELSRPSPAA